MTVTMIRTFIRSLGILCSLAVLVWVGGLVWFVKRIPNAPTDDGTPTDAIVVLTGGKGRLHEGVALLTQNKAKKLLVSGVNEQVGLADIKQFSGELDSTAVPSIEDRIVLGHLAQNTKQNAAETAAWMQSQQYQSLRLVTSNYHLPRSLLEFRSTMPGVTIIPHPVVSDNVKLESLWKFPNSAKLIIAEYHRYMSIRLKTAFTDSEG